MFRLASPDVETSGRTVRRRRVVSEVEEEEVVGEREGKETEGDGGAFLLAKVMKLSSQRTII